MTYLVDANLLIYATNRHAPVYQPARDWLAEQLAGPVRTVGIPWQNVLAFLRISTSAKLFESPLLPGEAWSLIEQWLAAPASWVPVAGPNHQAILGELIQQVGAAGNLVTDAHLVALARENGLTVASADSDFAKFDDVKWFNPLASAR